MKSWSWFTKAVTLLVLAIIILVLILKPFSCGHTKDFKQEKNTVDSIETAHKVEMAKATDSMYVLAIAINDKDREIAAMQRDRTVLLNDILEAKVRAAQIIEKIRQQRGSDTINLNDCSDMAEQFNDYIVKTDAEGKKCDSIVRTQADEMKIKDMQLSTAKDYIAQGDQDLKIVIALYTALDAAYQIKARGKGQLYMGLNAMGNVHQPFFVGPSLMYKTRKDFVVEAGAMYGNNGLLYTGGMKFLISTHKK